MDEKTHIYTVSELTKNIRTMLEEYFPAVWVQGEVSNFVFHSSGHMYFSLKDGDSVLAAVFFRNANQKVKFEIKDGMELVCFGKISVYDKRGQYQLYVDHVEPKGIGAQELALKQLVERLGKEGLFDKSRKKALPFIPERIGVITSPTGAAIKDIIKIATRRFPNIEILLCPVKVQGEGAKEEIVEAMKLFNELNNVDVIIVGRGGGSSEDLWAFNEESVARAIYDSKIPVISAVGHEIDWTVADLVSDVRAPTPSGAAEMAVPVKEELVAGVNSLLERMNNGLSNLVVQNEQRTDDILSLMDSSVSRFIAGKEDEFAAIAGKLEALSPLAVLARGYSVTENEKGAVITDASHLSENERIRVRLFKGTISGKVEKIQP